MFKVISRVFGFSAVVFLILSGCQMPSVSNSQARLGKRAQTPLSHIPFADDSELARIDELNDSQIIPWKLARRLAYIEFKGYYQSQFGWTASTLSERPVVIYNKDSRPQFYEFIVYNAADGAVGTLTAFAVKASTGFVSHVLPYVRRYPVLSKSPGYSEIDIMYPNSLLVGITGKAGDKPIGLVNPDTGDSGELLEDADMSEIFEDMRLLSDEDLMDIHGVSRSEMESNILVYWSQKKEDEDSVRDFWQQVDKQSNRIIRLSDAELDAKFMGTKGSNTRWVARNRNLYADDPNNMSSVSDVLLTRWNGWCVPSAMAWVYMAEGFGQKYVNGRYKPHYKGKPLYDVGDAEFNISGKRYKENGKKTGHYNYMWKDKLNRRAVEARSKEIDGGLYGDLMRWGNAYTNGGVSVTRHNKMVKNMTDNKRSAHWTPSWDTIHSHIYRNHAPVFITRSFDSSSGKELHFIVLVGTIEVTRYWDWWFIFKFTSNEREARMYMVHDNGAVTGKISKLTAAPRITTGDGTTYENENKNKSYYPYWFRESRLKDWASIPYLFN